MDGGYRKGCVMVMRVWGWGGGGYGEGVGGRRGGVDGE